MRKYIFALTCAAMMISVGQASGGIIVDRTVSVSNWDTQNQNRPIMDLTVDLTGLPAPSITDAAITFRLRADLNSSNEYADVSVEGFSFGRWLDNNNGNDVISGSDVGNQGLSILTGGATLGMSDLNARLVDEQLSFRFDFSSSVGDFVAEFASVRVQYEVADPVPEPTSLAIFGVMGLVSCGVRRRRRS